jgi:hypothetical protein
LKVLSLSFPGTMKNAPCLLFGTFHFLAILLACFLLLFLDFVLFGFNHALDFALGPSQFLPSHLLGVPEVFTG